MLLVMFLLLSGHSLSPSLQLSLDGLEKVVAFHFVSLLLDGLNVKLDFSVNHPPTSQNEYSATKTYHYQYKEPDDPAPVL